MNIEELRLYALAKPGVEEGLPFGPQTLVFKVGGKMFLALGIDNQPPTFNAKCDPDRAIALREEFSCIKPGYHMNKRHWNTVTMDNTLSTTQLQELIDHSYELVAPKKKK